jgi:hypothetical protein
VNEGNAVVLVNRNFYGQGAVSVTVRLRRAAAPRRARTSRIGSADWQDT